MIDMQNYIKHKRSWIEEEISKTLKKNREYAEKIYSINSEMIFDKQDLEVYLLIKSR
jgi:hypothetical protein